MTQHSPEHGSGAAAAATLLTALAHAGIRLKLVGRDGLEVKAPRGALTSELREGLARHKEDLVAWLALGSRQGGAEADLPTIVPDAENLYEPFLPSDLQQSFMIGSREGFEYYVRPHQYMEFDFDELDPVRFEEALNRALYRQRRSLVVARDDMRLQTVRDPAPVRVEVYDLRRQPEPEAREQMARVRAVMQREEPPHDRWPWLHPRITLYGAGRARLHYNNNNLFTDAPSGSALINAALHYYEHPDQPLPELELSFRDSVLALAGLEESSLGRESQRYWCDRMADWPEAPAIPVLPGMDNRGRSMLHRRDFLLPPALWSKLKRRADVHGLTLTNMLLGAHTEVLAYWSGSRHFLINNMITHRLPLHPQSNEVLGQFASLYPLEVDWRHEEGFRERVRRLQSQVVSDVSHSHWSGAKVLQELNRVRRTPGRAICPFAVGSALFVGPTKRPHYSMLETPQTLLDTEFWDLSDGHLWVIWDVIESMFPEGLIDAMFDAYLALLTTLAEDDSAWERNAFELLPAEQHLQRIALNATPAAPAGLLHGALGRTAEQRPDTSAVLDAQGRLTYAELYRRSRLLAERIAQRGARPGDMVAVVVPKGVEQIVAVQGVLAADAVYVPADPSWPDDRLRYILQDTGATVVLTTGELRERIGSLTGAPVCMVHEADPEDGAGGPKPEAGRGEAAGPGTAARTPDDLAYVIYTSGSTGRPKGAMLNHSGPLNTIVGINDRFGIGPDDVLFGISSLWFDLSVYDIFGAAEAGATLVLPAAHETDPASWIELVRSRGVTVWNSVPALMQLFVEAADAAGVRFPALRTVLLSGDWIPVDLPERIRRVAPHARVVGLGGATEASIWSICFPVDERDPEWASVPYGKPLAGQSWHILDATGRDAPTWVTGDLYIGGAGLALGYLGDPKRTHAVFVTHPRTGERLYRTGDLGRYLPSGDIEFLGRADFQVKIQGFRVELGEIESALLELAAVRQAVVTTRDSGAGKQLVAFVVSEDRAQPPSEQAVQAALGERLPRYMVPGRIFAVDRLPLTANGKLDRRALEELVAGRQEQAGERPCTPPRTPVEKALVEIWESVLACGDVGIHDDFFDLGGQSFAALRVIGSIAERYGRRIPLGVLLERRTVAALAEHLEQSENAWSPVVRLSAAEAPTARAPYFLVHPAGGNVLCYRRLSELMDRPCYALQAPVPERAEDAHDKAEELAQLYVHALLEVQPRGPYRLGGWSSGAVLAFEMARQLERRGERVEHVAVFDCPAPLVSREIDEARLLLWFLEDLDIGFDPAPGDAEALREPAGLGWDARLDGLVAFVEARGLAAGLPSRADLEATLAVFRGTVRACNRYQASAISAEVTVLRATDGGVSEFADHPYAGNPDWGWRRLTSGRVDTATTRATHHTLLTDERAVSAAAGVLNRP